MCRAFDPAAYGQGFPQLLRVVNEGHTIGRAFPGIDPSEGCVQD